MRFEIRAGGGLLILVGLVVLSGAVFALGLIAGYEMARQNQVDAGSLASVYPVPSPALSPVVAPTPAAAAMNEPAVPAPPMAHPAASAAPTSHEVKTAAVPPPPEAAPPPPPPSGHALSEEGMPPSRPESSPNGYPASSPGAPAPGASPSAAKNLASASAPPAVRRRPFNIQIDAVMDMSGAQRMVARLRQLGYQPTIVRTTIAGQTWYRVRVGPYATEEEARAAQERLRQQYQAAFSSPHAR